MCRDMNAPAPSAPDAHDDLDHASTANAEANLHGDAPPFGEPAMVILETQAQAAEIEDGALDPDDSHSTRRR
jgi:hypothetical protein